MSRVRTPENINIAALKKKAATVFDPMQAGSGTPWEDRGTNGVVGAFLKTCIMSMFSPGKLTRSIRRPETTNDARGFLFGICGIWAVSAVVHYAYFVWQETKSPLYTETLYPNVYILGALVLGLGGGGAFFLFKIYAIIYGKLASTEGAVLLPDVLVYNVSAYAVGPSLLALIPFAGPFLAVVWIFISMVIIGTTRLRLKMAAAVIDSFLPLLAVVLSVVGFYYIVERGINDHVGIYHAVDMKDPPKASATAAGAPATP